MKISDNGILFIKQREGLKLKAYQDSVGVWTIGYGHTHGVNKGDVIIENQATLFLLEDLSISESDVNRLVKVAINQNQYDALVSFQFNTGELKNSSVLKHLNQKQYLSAGRDFLLWCKGHVNGKLVKIKGLYTRRTLEMNLFLS